jgi:hypothetical protein
MMATADRRATAGSTSEQRGSEGGRRIERRSEMIERLDAWMGNGSR